MSFRAAGEESCRVPHEQARCFSCTQHDRTTQPCHSELRAKNPAASHTSRPDASLALSMTGVVAALLAVPDSALGAILDGDAELDQLLADAVGGGEVLPLPGLGALIDQILDVGIVGPR